MLLKFTKAEVVRVIKKSDPKKAPGASLTISKQTITFEVGSNRQENNELTADASECESTTPITRPSRTRETRINAGLRTRRAVCILRSPTALNHTYLS
ncbi:hypothetical protein EVAR_16711_1 [Eumeta japonica]|uniref:Uncharacterized protein n=1 Tax=Eumeta variegata TaxID=151549 RepID=A0A4C1V6M2_EUMVA|nr:hypothetical protein EVAR_16711_1 [Eumeta japonica]